jgi:hypothetical protein
MFGPCLLNASRRASNSPMGRKENRLLIVERPTRPRLGSKNVAARLPYTPHAKECLFLQDPELASLTTPAAT